MTDTQRMARCTYYNGKKPQGAYSSSSCGNGRDGGVCTCEVPSSTELAFFESCVEGSRNASICKHCGMSVVAHQTPTCPPGLKKHKPGTTYEPRGDQGFDRFYCGCHGWD